MAMLDSVKTTYKVQREGLQETSKQELDSAYTKAVKTMNEKLSGL